MTYRGTTNRNERGSSTDRRRRREWLVQTYQADVYGVRAHSPMLGETFTVFPKEGWGADKIIADLVDGGLEVLDTKVPCCRCYRCGNLLTTDTVSPDRIRPGADGGTYRRENIRPACSGCQSRTGAVLGNERKKAKNA